MISVRRKSWLTLSLGFGVAVLALGTVLLVQDARHGWPFTRHHSQTVTAAHAPDAVVSDSPQSGAARATVDIDPSKLTQLGVQFETVRRERLGRSGRYPVVVTPDERRLSHIHTRVAGWVEQLHVNTGDRVRPGVALASVFSQELFASQTEYLSARQRSAATPGSAVQSAGRTRLKVLGLSDGDIDRLERTGTVQRLFTVTSPRTGIVLSRGVTVGTAVDPSTELMTIADLSQVWAIAEIPESDAAAVAVGSKGVLQFAGSNRDAMDAAVEFIYPTLTERTRTVRVRFAIDNSAAALRPGVYGVVSFASSTRDALTVPRDSIVDTGESQHVFLRAGDGTLEPRTIKVGARLAGRVEILEGIAAGDQVVTSGVFLIDSESRLRASGVGPAHAGHSRSSAPEEAEPPVDPPASGEHSGHGG
jgi:membrane fusion protein, copper/silver efflux system